MLLTKIVSHGSSIGVQEIRPTLHMLRDNVPGGGGGNNAGEERRTPSTPNECCNAFACPGPTNTPDGKCICRVDSCFDCSKVEKDTHRKYIKLMRRYNKTYPSKSLKVNVRIVRTALKPGDDEGSNKDSASLAYMQTVSSVLGDGVNDDAALDAWLAQHNGDGDGLFVLGDTSGDGDLSFIIEETAAMMAVELNALDSAGSSERSATAAEQEIQRLKEALEVSELRNKELATARASSLLPPMLSHSPNHRSRRSLRRPHYQRLL